MSDPLILVDRDGDVATLTLNDPARLNAMSHAMGEAFAEQVAGLASDDRLRAVVLTGSGRAFCAGGDLEMIKDRAQQGATNPVLARRDIRDSMRSFYKLFLSVRDLPCPTVAAINGTAIGAGLCVALACDARVASVRAKLGLNFTRIGLQPGMGATWTLPRLVGPARAAEILYSSRIFSGEQAAQIGLVNQAVEPDAVLSTARELATEFAANAPMAIRATKRALARTFDSSLEDQLSFEAEEQAICFESADVRRGLQAVAEKTAPKFEGN